MTTENISSIALHVVNQYNQAGKHLVSAWRTGALGAVNSVASRSGQLPSLPFISEDIKANVSKVGEKLHGFVTERLQKDSDIAVRIMDSVTARTHSGIEYLNNATASVQSGVGQNVIKAIEKINLPAAKLSMKIADKIAEGAKAIESRVAGQLDAVEAAVDQVVAPVKARAKAASTRARRA